MIWEYMPYVPPLIFAAAVSAALALFAWRRTDVPGAFPFGLLLLAVVEWSLTYTLELGGVGLRSKLFWVKTEYLGITTVPVFWLAFVLQYTGRGQWLTSRRWALLLVVPLLTTVFACTNEAHGLIWSDIRLDTSGPYVMLDLTYGAWWVIHVVYSYCLLVIGTLLLIQGLFRSPPLYRGQAVALLIGALVPWIGNAMYIFDLNPLPNMDWTPAAFSLTGLVIGWALFRYRLFDIGPVAREAVFENMSDGVIVLDSHDRIVDLNPAAQTILGWTADSGIGQSLAQMSPPLHEIFLGHRGKPGVHTEIVTCPRDAQRTCDIRISPFGHGSGDSASHLIVLRDVTEHKRAEQGLRRRAEELAALQATLLDVTAPHELPALLQTIVERAARLLNAAGGGMYLSDPARKELRCVVSYNTPRDYTGTVLSYGEGASGTVALTGEPLIIDDYRTWPGRAAAFESDQPFTAVLSAPMVWQGEVIGVIDLLDDVEQRHFTQPDLELLTLFAEHAAIAVENGRLLQAEQEQRKLTQALEKAARAISSTLDIDLVLDLILKQVADVVAGDAFNIMLVDEGIARVVRSRGYDQMGVEDLISSFVVPLSDYPNLARMVYSGQPTLIPDTAADPDWVEAERWEWQRSYVAAPISTAGVTVGLLNVDSAEAGRFTAADAQRLHAFADHVAIAIENARLYQELHSYAEQLQQRVEERTAELEAQYANLDAILRSVGDAILMADQDMRVLYVNPAYTVATGYTAEEIIGIPASSIGAGAGSEQDRESVAAAMAEGRTWRGEVIGHRKDGRTYDAALTVAPVHDAEGRLIGYVASHRDISQSKDLERARSQFITNVSHQLRTPVTTLQLNLHLMQQAEQPENNRPLLSSMEEQITWLARMIEDTLEMTTLDSGKAASSWRSVNLMLLIQNTITRYQGRAIESGLTLMIDALPSDLPPIQADERRLAQALNEIVENSITYTPSGGQVGLSAQVVQEGDEEGEWLAIAVRDTGPGIPLDEQARVFDRFFRGSLVEAGNIPGTGLGLSIAEEIVRAHGGHITVDSEEGAGATFTIWLPLAD
jgi:PAS domain S-box-containing protein